MEIAVSYDSKQLKELIQEDLQRKVNAHIPLDKIEVKVRSKQNYRDDSWERGELKLDMKVDI